MVCMAEITSGSSFEPNNPREQETGVRLIVIESENDLEKKTQALKSQKQILAIWKGNNRGGKPNIQEQFQAQHSMEHTCSQDAIELIPQTDSSTHVLGHKCAQTEKAPVSAVPHPL